MTVPGSPTVRRRRLAAELREIRESKGKSGDAVAAALHWSPSKISRYERAKTGLQPREVERLLDYYEITGPRRELLLALAEDATQKGWWEDSATPFRRLPPVHRPRGRGESIAIWHVDVVRVCSRQRLMPGTLSALQQDRASPPGMIGRLVRVRMRRQQVIDRADLELSVVIDESVLQRRVGDDA